MLDNAETYTTAVGRFLFSNTKTKKTEQGAYSTGKTNKLSDRQKLFLRDFRQMKYTIIILVAFLSIAQLGVAQEAMTLRECREMAIGYNKELQNAAYQKQESRENQKVARTAYLPSVSASASAMYLPDVDDISLSQEGVLPHTTSLEAAQRGEFIPNSGTYMPANTIEMGDLFILNGGLSVSQPIYTGGKIRYSNKQADAGVAIYDHSYNLKYSQIIEQTDQAYWNLASIAAQVKLAEKYIAMLSELEDQMSEMHKLGLRPASEKLRVSVQKNEAELNLLRAKNGLKLSKMRLNQILGRPLDTELQIADSLQAEVKLYDVQRGVETALSNRSELKILEQQVKISEYNQRITLADYLPQLGVQASYSAFYLENLTDEINFTPQLAAQLTIPIFQWGQGRRKHSVAKLRTQQAQTTLSNTNELISLEVQQVKVQIEEAYEAILIAKKNIKEAQESLEETQESFNVGLNTTTDLLNANAAWQNANARLIGALSTYEVLKTTWARVTGELKPVE